MKKILAFSLAEVLIALTIVGVVSAMTVPTLMKDHQRRTSVTQLRKVYSEIEQAAELYMSRNRAMNLREAGVRGQNGAIELIESNFKITRRCEATSTPCFAPLDEYKKIDGTVITSWTPTVHYTIASGAAIGLVYSAEDSRLCTIVVDTNGQAGPNIVGRDLFALYLYNDGTLDDRGSSAPLTAAQRTTLFNNNCVSGSGGTWNGCFGRILNDNWEMRY